MKGRQPISTYRDLVVWQEAMKLTEACYRLTRSFPKEELCGLSAQIRRSSVSIPSNIAEGYGRESTGNYIQFLKIAQGSLRELETQLMLCNRLQLANSQSTESTLAKCDDIGKMLHALIRSVQRTKK